MTTPRGKRQRELAGEIVGRLVRRHSIAIVLFHQAVAERLGLGPTDHKCLDLLRERGPMTGSDLAAITDLTTGAITGVVARLERAGYVQREPDPQDRRQQILSPVLERMRDIQHVFGPIRNDVAALLERFDTPRLTAIAEFLTGSTDLAYRHVALLRAQATAQAPDPAGTKGRPVRSPKRVGGEPKTRQERRQKATP
jgi:DNA-binding MarR family transcriptional regulator